MVKQGYKQTEIGLIPEDWDVYRVGEIAKFQGGSQPPIAYFSSQSKRGYIRLVQIRDYKTDKYETYIPTHLAKRFCDENDIMIGRYGPPIFQILRGIKGAYNVALIKAIPVNVFKEFLFYTLKRNDIFEYIELLSRRSSGQTGVDLVGLNEYAIALPPLPEQQRIAEALSDADSLISSLDKLIAKKKAIKQGTMQELLTGKKRLDGFNDEWMEDTFCHVFDFMSTNAFTRAQLLPKGKVKNIHYGDVLIKYGAYIDANNAEISYIMESVSIDRFSESSYVKSGDVIIADTAEDNTVGKAVEVIHVNCKILSGQHTLLCRPKVKFAEKFLGYYLNSSSFHNQLIPYITGTKVSAISKASLSSIAIKYPVYAEQTAISTILSDMDSEIEALEKKLAKYRQIKQGMMQQLLTGKIRLVDESTTALSTAKIVEIPQEHQKQHGHNHQFDDAVAIAVIVNAFYSDKYPLGRKKVQKLLYLLRRKQEESVTEFKKKAAGPYADEVRYKGGERIAKDNGYITVTESKTGSTFSKGQKIDSALSYVSRWKMQPDMDWLVAQFKYTKTNTLELLATVDMAICDLENDCVEVSVDSIKNLIHTNKEWKAKLAKTYFSDQNIAWAMDECKKIFG